MTIKDQLINRLDNPPYSTVTERDAYVDGIITVFEALMNQERNDMMKAWYSGISDYRNRKD